MFAWNATSNPPAVNAAMLGLVPCIMPRPQLLLPRLPTVQRLPVFAWNATSNPPGTPMMLGLVPAIMPRPQFLVPAIPTVQREPVFA